ncbi:MAG: cell surface protein SprA [Bacteroidaceae bacterium]|nr:cell surface protein SprA [Bacteroidaceae bacterium]
MRLRTALSILILFAFIQGIFAQGDVRTETDSLANDTTSNGSIKTRYPISHIVPNSVSDFKRYPLDLRLPQNIVTDTLYNEKDSTYSFATRLGSSLLSTPISLTPEQYSKWHMKQSMQNYFRDKNKTEFENAMNKDKFDFTDMHFDLGPAEKIFGPGGVRIKTQGNAEMKIGYSMQTIDNPSLPERSRSTNSFDFDEKINLNVKGSVGDKMNLDFNYNTEATFSFDAQKINLKYEGKEDEVIKLIEAGNVSFGSKSSLIKGASSLFGVRTDFQFGKLSLQTVISQKKSNSTTVSSKGGTQLTTFEIEVADYDENRHFFLAHYFRDNYDRAMAQLPTIISGITINRVEVWVTNKKSDHSSPRNVVAFTDIGESEHISNSKWHAAGGTRIPHNNANDLYSTMNTTYAAIRDIDQVNNILNGNNDINGGLDYEKLSNARMLSSSEYTVNRELGYISLKNSLRADEVLAIAYEYTYGGETYQVGEFANDQKESSATLFVKLLKPNACSPKNGCWDLMMKNVYALGTRSLQSNSFKLDIYYASDSLGTNITYLPEESLKSTPLLRLMNLDRLDTNNTKEAPNGFFDFVQGYTVDPSSGRIFFPSVEPFGNYLKNKIGNDAIAEKYIFQELYDSTKTIAKQIAEKDKFYLIGEYTGSSANVIQTGSTNIPRGSVVVTAGGVTLVENVDYQVDYSSGVVTILNQSIIDAGTNVNVSLESNTLFNMQRKTVLGLNWQYDFSDELNFGGTFMTLSEKPMTSKVDMGTEPLNNTIWGFNVAWKKESQWLTNMLDRLPLISCTVPSSINLTAEFARLEAGTSSEIQSQASYIDDFEGTENGIDLSAPSAWVLASLPTGMPNSNLTNNILTGYNRALINWYTIDPLFTRRSSSLTPAHIKSDVEQLSNHYVREVYERELYPNKESTYGESSTLSLMNVSFYPNERGPYNLDPDLTYDGKLNNPEKRWGGITRQLTTTDFEAANIQYIEFWMLDPFIYDQTEMGGDLYFNLGEVSEDILKDGKKFFENGLPSSNNTYGYEETVWGRVPTTNSLVYAFDNNAGSRDQQDAGLNGLKSNEEAQFPTYAAYLDAIKGKVRQEVYDSIANDPAGDNYHYFRGGDYDAVQKSILERYKYFNNFEGNSPSSGDDSYNSAAKTTPDIEDANQDFTMDEYENFFQYKISLRPDDMVVGRNYITDKRSVSTKLRNGNTESVDWYKFRIPINEYEKVVGTIRDFTSIRFMRMYMTSFRKPITLRFATMQLIRGDWRPYQQAIASINNTSPSISGDFTMSAVNIEEHGDRRPVNYVLPPGISRILDPDQPQLRQDNEQSLSLHVNNLGSKESRAIYKKSNLDIRQYERIQLFVHAEAPELDVTQLKNNDVSLFVRLGSDYKSNYYEYEVPLSITPHGTYDVYGNSGATTVWPTENMINIPLTKLTNIKVRRNTLRNNNSSGVTNTTIYSEYDEDTPKNRISIVGNPTLGQIKVMMIGIRNNTGNAKSATVWVNEMRLLGFRNKSGWAAQGNLDIKLSDLGSIAAQGRIETAGFGGLEDKLASRRTDDFYSYTMTGTFDFGRFLPAKAKIALPTYYSFSREVTSPLYSPFDTDLLLDDVLGSYSGAARDSLRNIAEVRSTTRNFSLSNAKINISSKTPMPYDPANLSFSYSYSRTDNSGSTVNWENIINWKASLNYAYSSPIKTIKPFEKIQSKSKWLKILKEWGVNPLPQNLSFNTDMTRSYHELQVRDLNSMTGGSEIPLTFSQQFYWNRAFTLKWDPTTNLRMDLRTGTNAEIEEPYVPVNKKRYPNEYEIWKDSVRMSIKGMGRPLTYQQNFSASYSLPLNKLPIFEWLKADANYSSSYNWARGNKTSNINFGNNISNKRDISINTTFDFEKLYNLVPYLEETNKRFASSKKNSRSTTKRTAKKDDKKKEKKKKNKPFSTEIQLYEDSTFTVKHGLGNKKFDIIARRKNGKLYKLKYKVVDENNILIKSKDTVSLRIMLTAKDKNEKSSFAKNMQYPTRMLMMLRNASISYKNSYAMSLPGFMPEIGDLFGQKKHSGVFAPGLDFAFGLTDDSYLKKAHERNWLLKSDSISQQASTNAAEDLQLKVVLEPATDLKIDLNASWTRNKSRTIQFMYDGMPSTESGGFSMTTITLGNSFGGSNADNNYKSSVYDKFIANIDRVQQIMENRYVGSVYPASSSLAGQPYDPANGSVNKYSAEVMIPAFLGAYSNGSSTTGKASDIFPSFMRMLPNWRIKYSGLSKLAFFKKYFKSVNIEHGYKSVYAVGSYNTYATYMEYTNGIGFVNNTTTGLPTPSGRYNISSVSLNESFSPLIGIDVTTKNDIKIGTKYIQSRVLNLSLTSIQLSETYSQELAVNIGYKFVGLKLFGGGSKKAKKKSSSSTGNDLNIRADFSYKNMTSLVRSIDKGTTQATNGTKSFNYSLSADYTYSKMLTFSFYFDRQATIPLISTNSYPTTTTDFGVSMRFSLTR